MSWEVYQRRGRRPSADPKLTIRRNGALGVNAATVATLRRHAPDSSERVFVVLCFDPESQCIYLKPAGIDDENAYPVHAVSLTNMYVTGVNFLRFFKIDHERAYRLRGEWHADEGGLSFFLATAEDVSRTNEH